jgi:peptidoglycan/xylan/chitin deacetylase (PgdA/CDA1 family)
MNKTYRKILLSLSILIVIGLVGYNLVNSKIYLSKAKNINKENLKINDKVDLVKTTVISRNRDFKEEPLINNNRSIPILMYHSIEYEKGNELRLPVEKFREQMKYLKDKNYTTLNLDELYNFLVNNKAIPEKSVVITFDDGYEDNYKNAYPILKEFGFNACIFVITSTIDNDKSYLTSNQLRQMDANGIEIESHTLNHNDLSKLSYKDQIDTLEKSKEYIERTLNKKVKYIGYPFGKWNEDTIKATKKLGYSMAFTTIGGWAQKEEGIYTLNRVYISSNFGISEFKRRLNNPQYNSYN